MIKELVDLIHEAMDQHELSRDFYHRLAHRVTHPDTRETFEYLAKKAEENKTRLHQCLTPEGCPVVPPVREALAAQKALSWLLGGLRVRGWPTATDAPGALPDEGLGAGVEASMNPLPAPLPDAAHLRHPGDFGGGERQLGGPDAGA